MKAVNPTRNKIIKWLPGLVISLIVIYLLARISNWDQLSLAFQEYRLTDFALAVGLTTCFLISRSQGWRILLGKQATYSQSFFTISIGYLLNNLLPLRAGEIGRAVVMGRATNAGPAKVLSSIVIERAFDLLIAASLVLSTLPLALSMEWLRPIAYVIMVVVICVLLCLFFMAKNPQKIKMRIQNISNKNNPILRFIGPQLNGLLDGFAVMNKPSNLFLGFFWITVSWFFSILQYYLMMIPFSTGTHFWWGAFANSVLAMGVAIPSAPAALGVFEGSLVAALSILGIDNSPALAFAIFLHFTQFIVTGIFGLWGLIREGRSFSTLLADLQVMPKNSE